jgi:hypothetical protein
MVKPAFETAEELSNRLGVSTAELARCAENAPRYAKIGGRLIFPAAGVTPGQFRKAALTLMFENLRRMSAPVKE